MTAATNTNLVGIATKFQSSQIVVYVGSDNKLYDLFWQNSKWEQYDVFQAAHVNISGPQPPFPKQASPLAGFSFEVYNAAYVVYIDQYDRVQELQFAGNVELIPGLPALIGPDKPRSDSPLTAFAWEGQRSTHIFYIDQDNDVRELYWLWPGSTPWQKNDLSIHTGTTGTAAPRPGSPMGGYVFENQSTQHVFYIAGDRDGSIWELYYSGGHWQTNNLSATPGAVPPATDSPLACYVCEYENTQHVIYIGEDRAIHELYWSGTWKHNNLTQITNTPQPDVGSALVGYASEYESTEHIIYISNGDIQELYRSGNEWYVTNLTVSSGSGATSALPGTPLAGYAFENQKTEHIFYVDANRQVHELYRSGNAWNAGEVST